VRHLAGRNTPVPSIGLNCLFCTSARWRTKSEDGRDTHVLDISPVSKVCVPLYQPTPCAGNTFLRDLDAAISSQLLVVETEFQVDEFVIRSLKFKNASFVF